MRKSLLTLSYLKTITFLVCAFKSFCSLHRTSAIFYFWIENKKYIYMDT